MSQTEPVGSTNFQLEVDQQLASKQPLNCTDVVRSHDIAVQFPPELSYDTTVVIHVVVTYKSQVEKL